MPKKLKLYEVEFAAIYPVGHCLIIAAYSKKQAEEIARQTITHTSDFKVTLIRFNKPKVIVYLSGEY